MSPSAGIDLRLRDGASIPALGLGTWRLSDEDAARLVPIAVEAGYRHIDTAQAYGNEPGVGAGIRAAGLPREQMFITSKQRTRDQGRGTTRRSLEGSLQRLGLDYLDHFLIHWPLPQRGLYPETWSELARAQEEGLARSIGVSNFLPEHIDRLIDHTGVTPAVNQLELHPHYQQAPVRDFHAHHGILIESYSPLGGDGASALEDPAIAALASKHGRTPAQVALRWHVQQGLAVLPKSSTPARIRENAELWDFELDAEDMRRIGALDRPDGKRLPAPEQMDEAF